MDKLSSIISQNKSKKAPAYQWQDLALRVIAELGVPGFKRNSVFRIAKEYSRQDIEKALDDTKELAQGGEKWKYFFKVIANYNVDRKQQ